MSRNHFVGGSGNHERETWRNMEPRIVLVRQVWQSTGRQWTTVQHLDGNCWKIPLICLRAFTQGLDFTNSPFLQHLLRLEPVDYLCVCSPVQSRKRISFYYTPDFMTFGCNCPPFVQFTYLVTFLY